MNGKLHPLRLGIAGGILWGGLLFITTLLSIYTGYALFWLSQWMDLYPGFDLSIKGAFLAFIYGFIDGFVSLFLLGWLYNVLGGNGKHS